LSGIDARALKDVGLKLPLSHHPIVGQIGSLLPFLNNLEPRMPGTKITGASLALLNAFMISHPLEVLSGVAGMNGVRYSGFGQLLPERTYQHFPAFRHLSILIVIPFLGIGTYAINYTLLPVHRKVLRRSLAVFREDSI
jgi:hypothetical protein